MKDASLNAYPFNSRPVRDAENKILSDLSAGLVESTLGVTGDRDARDAARVDAYTIRRTSLTEQVLEWIQEGETFGYKLGWVDSQLAAIRAVSSLHDDGLISAENAALVLNAALGLKCPSRPPVRDQQPLLKFGPGGDFTREVM